MIAHLKNSVMCEQTSGKVKRCVFARVSCHASWVSGVAPATGKHRVSLIKVCSFGERRQNMSASAFKHCNMEKQGATVFLCEPTVLTRVCASILNHEKVGERKVRIGRSFLVFLGWRKIVDGLESAG